MTTGKVRRWRCKDQRTGGYFWEVCIAVGDGKLDIITFSGPNASGRSARYAEQFGWKPDTPDTIEHVPVAPQLPAPEPSLDDLLS